MTGRLSGTVDGRPVEIFCDGRSVRLAVPGILSAWRLRGPASAAAAALKLLDRAGCSLSVTVGALTLPVLPKPHPVVRWFGPEFIRE